VSTDATLARGASSNSPRRRSATAHEIEREAARAPERYVPCSTTLRVAGRFEAGQQRGNAAMLWTITAVLLVLWVLGFTAFHTVGAWIHLLLVLAVISAIFNLVSGRRAVV
jgi:hypothetical protein